MAEVIADRVLETSTTTGTGAYTLAGAVAGYRTFASAGATNGDTARVYVEAVDANGVPTGDWETGRYTWGTGGTLARTQIEASSNGGAAVNWAAGTKRLSISTTAARMSQLADMQRVALDAWGIPAGTGVLNGTPLNYGGNWTVTGPGQATTVRNAAGYAVDTSGSNAYVFVTNSTRVRRYAQRWSGPSGSFPTLAVCVGASLNNMLHVNFGAGTGVDSRLWINGTPSLAVAFGGAIRNCPAFDNGQIWEFQLDIATDNSGVFLVLVNGVAVAWGQDPQIAAWGASLDTAMGQLHGANERIYGMFDYTELPPARNLANIPEIVDFMASGAPLRPASLMVAPAGTVQKADFDVVAREQRDIVFRSDFAVTMHRKAGNGYGVREYYGNGTYNPADPGDTYTEWSTGILGFRVVTGGGLRASFPHPAFGYGDAVFPSITIGSESSSSFRIVRGDNVGSLPAAPDGSLGVVPNNLYQRRSGAWVAV